MVFAKFALFLGFFDAIFKWYFGNFSTQKLDFVVKLFF